jgi:hypothetical protein
MLLGVGLSHSRTDKPLPSGIGSPGRQDHRAHGAGSALAAVAVGRTVDPGLVRGEDCPHPADSTATITTWTTRVVAILLMTNSASARCALLPFKDALANAAIAN